MDLRPPGESGTQGLLTHNASPQKWHLLSRSPTLVPLSAQKALLAGRSAGGLLLARSASGHRKIRVCSAGRPVATAWKETTADPAAHGNIRSGRWLGRAQAPERPHHPQPGRGLRAVERTRHLFVREPVDHAQRERLALRFRQRLECRAHLEHRSGRVGRSSTAARSHDPPALPLILAPGRGREPAALAWASVRECTLSALSDGRLRTRHLRSR